MKSLLMKAVLVIALVSSAVMINAESIKGSGLVNTTSYEVSAYKQLIVDGNFDVVLNYGTKTEVSIKTDENLQNMILIDASNDALYIRTKENMGSASELTLYITVTNLEQMGFNNVLSVSTENPIWFDNLDVNLNAIGASRLHFAGNKVNISMEGSGDLELAGRVNEVNINNDGIGAIKTGSLSANVFSVKTSKKSEIQMMMTAEKEKSFKTLSTVKRNSHPKA